jgi:hypothetical protein
MSYPIPRIRAARNGTPKPTLNPMMSLLLVPFVVPSRILLPPPVADVVDVLVAGI